MLKENPFYITGIIPEPFFCDRVKETSWFLQTLGNKAHILLTSPRRMGKTQLIRHVFEHPDIKDNFYTFYTDIYPTTSLHEFVLFLSKEIYSVLVPKGRTALDRFLSAIHSLSGCLGFDPLTNTPTLNIKLGDIHSPELTIEEIFNYLESADKPCIFAIDEFQQIAYYPEKNIEALLRTHIQKTNNSLFIYAGSDRHVLENMFNSSAKPFYNSAEQTHLNCIPKDTYVDFAFGLFSSAGRKITTEALSYAYDLCEGHTYYVHNLLHNVFAYRDEDIIISKTEIELTLNEILEERGRTFGAMMNQLNFQQKETLIAIAKEGKATGVTSVSFVRKHSLKSPSSVQYAIKTLLEKQFITYEIAGSSKIYSLGDRFMAMWICRTY